MADRRLHGMCTGFRAVQVCLALWSALLCAGCKPGREAEKKHSSAASSRVWFEECAEESGLRFRHVFATQKEYYLPEIMSGGVGLLDYDNDGFLDVYFVQAASLTRPNPTPIATVCSETSATVHSRT